MLDGQAKKIIDPAIRSLAGRLAAAGIGANSVTIAGFIIGLAAAFAISFGWFIAGLVLVLVSRLADGLDGQIARLSKPSDLGGYLDIVLDFAFYGAVPLGFVLADPAANALPGAVLILSFYVNGTSFLAYAVMAERRGLTEAPRGAKSLYFTTGLAEATETIGFFVLACLFPSWFAVLAWLFAAICFYTALSRIVLAGKTFIV